MKLFLFSVFSLIFFSLKAQSGSDLNMGSFYYLEGKWIIEKPDKNIFEEWKKENDTLMISKSYYVQNGDTANAENVMLEKIGDEIFYIPTVEHNEGPVKFRLTSLVKNKAVFENLEHDFPTKIVYEKINNDSLHASIEGIVEGKTKVIDYYFKRIK
jgi:hypothetical protein